jgi:iron complex transport system ATP-binding protein
MATDKGGKYMSTLYTKNLSISYGNKLIVDNLNIKIPKGKITALVGPNGSGKSTILKTIARILKPNSGTVYIDGKAIHKESTKLVAKKLAILPQNPLAPDGLTVRELVSYGRFPHQKGFGKLTEEDYKVINWALEVTGMSELADRPVERLSGGQRQRAWIAMAIAQETEILLLDEPATFLDMAHQIEVLKLLEKLNIQEKRTIVMVIHELNHASRFAHNMVLIKDGKVEKEGNPIEVMTSDLLKKVFDIDCHILVDRKKGIPICVPCELASDLNYDSIGFLYNLKHASNS